MKLSTLPEWVNYINKVHPAQIELGLERVKQVATQLEIFPLTLPVITVAGTNGKGTVVEALSKIYMDCGYSVGTFTSPFLFDFTEQVRVNATPTNEETFCKVFDEIECARGTIRLTPFEFTTLAALLIFKKQLLDVLILEIGLGGRLDAVNIVDADLAIITSIGIDHTEWLGETREKIGFEKAGIFREKQLAVCGDFDTPLTILEQASLLNVKLYQQGIDFYYAEEDNFTWHYKETKLTNLPKTHLLTQNLSTALMGVHLLRDQLPFQSENILNAFKHLSLPGRMQVVAGKPIEIYDVAHNPDAVRKLTHFLSQNKTTGKTTAVFSMLADKDIDGCLHLIRDQINEWFVAPLETRRSFSLTDLKTKFNKNAIEPVHFYPSIQAAYQAALKNSQKQDRLVVFGSFHTVAAVKMLPC